MLSEHITHMAGGDMWRATRWTCDEELQLKACAKGAATPIVVGCLEMCYDDNS